MDELPKRFTPREILLLIDGLNQQLVELQEYRAESSLQIEPSSSWSKYVIQISNRVKYLKREAVLRNINSDGLFNLQVHWSKLNQNYPDAIDALRHFPDYISDDMLQDVVRVTDQLRIKVDEESKTIDTVPEKANGGVKIEPDQTLELVKAVDGEWLTPMSLTDMANRLDNITPDKAKVILSDYGLKSAGNRQTWTVRLDIMPRNLRAKLEGKQ